MTEGYISSQAYAERLGEDFSLFRQAVAHKRGALGSRGGSGLAAPGVRRLAEKIAPITTTYGYGGKDRPLWSLADVERHEAELRTRLRAQGETRGQAFRKAWPRSASRSMAREDTESADAVRPRRGGGRWPAGFEGATDAQISEALARAGLSDRERTVLELRYGTGSSTGVGTQREVAGLLGVSQPLVSRVEREALAKVIGALRSSRGDEPRSTGDKRGEDAPVRS